MDYELIGSNEPDVLKCICENRGVDYNILELFLQPDRSHIQDYKSYNYMNEGKTLLLEAIQKGKKIGILVDSDVDGYCSAAMLYIYITKYIEYSNIIYFMHSGKQHGLYDDMCQQILDSEVDLMLIADASSNDFKQHKFLKDNGVSVLVLDHHKADRYSEYACVINNQLQQGVNKNLSGAGVVKKFLECLDNERQSKDSDELMDLLAVALVADMMSINDLETRYYTYKGFLNVQNPLLEELYDADQARSYTSVSYKIAPVINAYIRMGTNLTKDMLFKAIIGVEETKEVLIGKGTMELTLPEFVKYQASRVKKLQTAMVNENLESAIDTVDTNSAKVIILSELSNKNLSGLIANKVMDESKKAVFVLKEQDGFLKGSCRAPKELGSFKTFCKSTGIFDLAEGHESAFGVSIKIESMSKFIDIFNGEIKNIQRDKVDKHYEGRVSAFDILNVSDYNEIWSKGFEQPKFHISLKDVGEVEIIGSKRNTIKFKKDHVTFIKFLCDEETIAMFKEKNIKDIEIIGTFNINNWMDKTYPQVFIEKFEIIDSSNTKDVSDFVGWGL